MKYLIKKYLIFLQVIRVFKYLLMGVPRQTRKYINNNNNNNFIFFHLNASTLNNTGTVRSGGGEKTLRSSRLPPPKYQGSMMTKSLKSTDVGETHNISFEAPYTTTLAVHIDMLFFWCFVCNLWFLFIVRLNVVSCRVTL